MIKSMFDIKMQLSKKQKCLLTQRNEVLKTIFAGTDKMIELDGLISIECDDNVYNIIQKTLPKELHSYIRKKRCNECTFELSSERWFVDINFSQFQHLSIQGLNSCLLDCLMSDHTTNCSCGGTLTVVHTEFSNFVMIDLTMKSEIVAFALKDIPKTLNVLSIGFKLFACIEYMNPEAGHYVSHILRNERWERYDDLRNKVTLSDLSSEIMVQVLFYVKTN